MIRGAAIGELFGSSSFDTFIVSAGNKKAFDACQELIAGKNRGVVLMGDIGRGKSHLLESLAREFDRVHSYIPPVDEPGEMVGVPPLRELMDMQFNDAEDNYSPYLERSEIARHAHVEFWPMLDLVSALRKDALEGEVVERCMRCDLVLIDDLGREKVSDFIMQEFDRIVDYRYRQMLPIAVATNLTWAGIVDMYSGHTASRWAHSCKVVDISGKDYRIGGER